MKLKLILGLCFWVLLMVVSCNRDDISFDTSSKELSFSTDTLLCDTVYNQMRSETYAFKVYNNEDKDVLIPKISLSQGDASMYRINVDGTSGTEFTDVPLRKKDSLYVFVEIAPIATATEAIAEDQVLFDISTGQQHVTLLSVVQDAEYYIESNTNDNILTDDTTWTNDRVKVIFGTLTLAEGKTLTVEKGTKVYFHKNSDLNISKSATLNVDGNLGEEVIFRGDRSDTKYDTIPGNWNEIYFDEGATLNMNYAKVFGGNSGLNLNKATANISNSIIHTFLDFGIYATDSEIEAENLVMNNAGQSCIGIFEGGTYQFLHSTIANYWDLTSTHPALAVYASNEQTVDGETLTAPLDLSFKNSILYTSVSDAVMFNDNSADTFTYYLQNCLLKYNSASTAGFNFDSNANIVSSIKNEDPLFINSFIEKMNLRLEDDSPAKGKGNTTVAANVPLDIVEVSRTSNPSLGAYQ